MEATMGDNKIEGAVPLNEFRELKREITADLDSRLKGFEKILDTWGSSITDLIATMQDHHNKTLDLSIQPIKENMKRHAADLSELYDKDRENRDRFGMIEGRVKTLEDDKIDNKDNNSKWIGILGILAGILIAIMGFVIQ